MSKEEKIVTPSEEEVAAYGGADDTQAAAVATDAGASPAPASEGDEWREKYLRAVAELSNYQRRSEKDRRDSLRYAHADFARSLLPVVDDFDRLLTNAADGKASLESLVEGVKLTRENFLKVLQQFEVRPIVAQDQPFDPAVHEALMEQPSDHAERTVLQEVARGFKLHDRVLRPAKVIVSKQPG